MKSATSFGPFRLDPAERRLTRDGELLDVSGRYLDALVLLTQEAGSLVTKDRLHEEVWQGIPVTDEAITQCMRSLRKALGDDAANPRYIETVPRHGYRFIAEVVEDSDSVAVPTPASLSPVPAFEEPRARIVRLGLAGIAGGATAGLLGGVFYGFGVAAPGEAGGASVVLAMACITTLVAAVGALGVAFGIAAAATLARANRAAWIVGGGALGGLLEGGFVKLVGVDALRLLTVHAPGAITGAPEGLVLGGGVGLAFLLAERRGHTLARKAALAGLVGAAAGLAISLAGGRLMGGSLDLLLHALPDTRLSLDPLGALAGRPSFGGAARTVTAVLESAVFAAGVVAAMMWASGGDQPPNTISS